MKLLQREHEVLKRILQKVYYEKESIEVGEQWQVNVMRRIRGLGPITSGPNFFMLFEQFFWRLTPATCILILIFVALLFRLDFTPEYEVFTSLIYNTEEMTLVQLFGF
jgi:ABC-type uncharacterized transport system permease subunit